MKAKFVPALLCAFLHHALGADRAQEAVLRQWRWSTAAVAAGQAADLATSFRGYEANPLLRNAEGRLAAGRAAGIKGGITAGNAILQSWAIRRWPRSPAARLFTYVNFGVAGLHAGVAARNLRRGRRPQ